MYEYIYTEIQNIFGTVYTYFLHARGHYEKLMAY